MRAAAYFLDRVGGNHAARSRFLDIDVVVVRVWHVELVAKLSSRRLQHAVVPPPRLSWLESIRRGHPLSLLRPIAPFIGKFAGFEQESRRASVAPGAGDWFVARTEPRRERLASESVSEIGLSVYMPIALERVPAGRRPRMVERPMFPDYLFIYCLPTAEHWHMICVARGIAEILGGQKPVSIKEAAIEAIRLFEAKAAERAGKPRRSGAVWHYSKGDVVRITSGPFSGFYAQLTSAVNHHDRVRALVDIFKRSAETELSAFDLQQQQSSPLASGTKSG